MFECVGLGKEMVDMCLCDVASRIGGLSFNDIARDYLSQHSIGFPPRDCTEVSLEGLENPGEYLYRATPGTSSVALRFRPLKFLATGAPGPRLEAQHCG